MHESMEEVRDANGHLVCYCDATSGEIESIFKQQSIYATLPVGGKIAFVRYGTMTLIHRKTPTLFSVYSYPQTQP